MQAYELRNQIIREHYTRSLEGTNNLLFYFASTAPMEDQRRKLPESVVHALGLPSDVQSMYDYRSRYNGIYDRLYQQCVVSLCSDIEFMFKCVFERLQIQPGSGRGFFQRFRDVVSLLEENGYNFEAVSDQISELEVAFNIRHIAIHNFGLTDEEFIRRTGYRLGSGVFYVLGQKEYRRMFEGYCNFLKCFDSQIDA